MWGYRYHQIGLIIQQHLLSTQYLSYFMSLLQCFLKYLKLFKIEKNKNYLYAQKNIEKIEHDYSVWADDVSDEEY